LAQTHGYHQDGRQMLAATVAISILLAAIVTFAALRKLSHRTEVVESYARVGVPEDRLDRLAVILLAGAAGLLIGLAWAPIGIAAAIGLSAYFLLATAAHIRADDLKNLPTPAVIEVLALAALALRLATA
jgi:DoxX-like protein